MIRESQSTDWLERAMDRSALRSQLLAHNIANVNTPNYKRLELKFDDFLNDSTVTTALPLQVTNSKHRAPTTSINYAPQIVQEKTTSNRADHNNVDPDYEMVQVSENSLYFQALTTSWSKQISRIRQVIEGRG